MSLAKDEARRARVAIGRWTDLAEVDAALGQVLELLGGLERFIKPGQYVVVKPNLVAGAPATSGGTTHVELVEAVVRRIQALRPGRLAVVEGAAVADPVRTFELLGYRAMADRTGVELIDLDHAEHVPCPLADPVYPGVLEVARPIVECDVLVNICCLKTHINAGVTGAIKNSFGTVDQATRTRIHREFKLEECICDLSRIWPSDLIVVDGLVGAEGVAGGADFSRPVGAGLILAGDNVVAVDAVTTQVMRQDANVRSINWAAEHGLGPNRLEDVEVVGLDLDAATHPFLSPAQHLVESMHGLEFVDLGSCTGCRTTVEPAVSRYRGMQLNRPLRVVLGGEGRSDAIEVPRSEATGETADADGVLLVCGDCARGLQHEGQFIPGCPPTAESIHEFLRASGVACRRCHPVLQEALAEVEGEPFYPDLRAACGGEFVLWGPNRRPLPTDLALLVGDCMAHYYHNSRMRADQVLGGRGENVVLVPGCPPSAAAVRDAVAHLRDFAARRAAATSSAAPGQTAG